MSYEQCPTCGDTTYRPVPDQDDTVECASCRTPLRTHWLHLSEWHKEQ